MNWKLGDIAIIWNTVASYWVRYIGTECEIIGTDDLYTDGIHTYTVRLCDGLELGAADCHLRRRKDRDDSKDVCKWSDIDKICGWRPKEPVTVGVEEREKVHITIDR